MKWWSQKILERKPLSVKLGRGRKVNLGTHARPGSKKAEISSEVELEKHTACIQHVYSMCRAYVLYTYLGSIHSFVLLHIYITC